MKGIDNLKVCGWFKKPTGSQQEANRKPTGSQGEFQHNSAVK